MSTDIAALTDDAWDDEVVTKGIIDYQIRSPIHYVWYGIIFNRIYSSKAVKNIKSAYGEHRYEVYVIGTTEDEIWEQINYLITLYDTFNQTGNARYSKVLLDLEEIEWQGDLNYRYAKLVAIATTVKDNSHRIYDPYASMNLGVR